MKIEVTEEELGTIVQSLYSRSREIDKLTALSQEPKWHAERAEIGNPIIKLSKEHDTRTEGED